MKAKRYLSIVMMFVLLMLLCSVGAVANSSFDSDIAGDQYQNLAEAECALGLSSLNAPMSLNEENISLRALLEQAEPMTETDYDSLDIVSYPTSIVEEYLPQNINIIEVTVSGDDCYITYGIIETHTLVYLQYSLEDDSVVTVAVRDMDADSCVTFTAGEKRVEEDLTQGNTFRLSDAVLKKRWMPLILMVLMSLIAWKKFYGTKKG